MECLIAITASTNVAGIWILQNEIGQYIWKSLMAITMIVAIVKQILNYSKQIQAKKDLLLNYKSLFFDLEKIIILIKQKQKYDDELKKMFLQVIDKKYKLIQIEEDFKQDKKLIERCYNEVNIEFPPEYF